MDTLVSQRPQLWTEPDTPQNWRPREAGLQGAQKTHQEPEGLGVPGAEEM